MMFTVLRKGMNGTIANALLIGAILIALYDSGLHWLAVAGFRPIAVGLVRPFYAYLSYDEFWGLLWLVVGLALIAVYVGTRVERSRERDGEAL